MDNSDRRAWKQQADKRILSFSRSFSLETMSVDLRILSALGPPLWRLSPKVQKTKHFRKGQQNLWKNSSMRSNKCIPYISQTHNHNGPGFSAPQKYEKTKHFWKGLQHLWKTDRKTHRWDLQECASANLQNIYLPAVVWWFLARGRGEGPGDTLKSGRPPKTVENVGWEAQCLQKHDEN